VAGSLWSWSHGVEGTGHGIDTKNGEPRQVSSFAISRLINGTDTTEPDRLHCGRHRSHTGRVQPDFQALRGTSSPSFSRSARHLPRIPPLRSPMTIKEPALWQMNVGDASSLRRGRCQGCYSQSNRTWYWYTRLIKSRIASTTPTPPNIPPV